jgi:hypothetical protein
MGTKAIYIFLLGAIIGVLYSCSPVKRVLSNPKYYAEVKKQVILNGECVNDTITEEILKDTIIYKDTVIHDSFKVNMPMECHLDTIVNDFSVYLENGNLWVKWLGQVPTRTINKQTTHVVVDRAKEAILIDSCSNQARKIYELENESKRKGSIIFKLYIGLAAILLFLLRKPLMRLIGIV